MGCTSSTDSYDPNKPRKNIPFAQHMSVSLGMISNKELDELDKMRINLILDYWYDEGPKDGSGFGSGGGNS